MRVRALVLVATEEKNKGDDESSSNGNGIGENEGDGLGIDSETNGESPSSNIGDEGALNKEKDNPFEDSEYKGGEKRKSGFNIRISDLDPDIDSETDLPLRSKLAGGDIIIFRKHKDFEARATKKRNGDSTITNRLITYLAGEITVHYKDKFFCRTGQPEYNINMFKSVVDFIYRFEGSLTDLVGKNLSDIS